MKRGYSNAVYTDAVVFHGTDFRKTQRDAYMSKRKQEIKGSVLIRRRALDAGPGRIWTLFQYVSARLLFELIAAVVTLRIGPARSGLAGIWAGLTAPAADHSKPVKDEVLGRVPSDRVEAGTSRQDPNRA